MAIWLELLQAQPGSLIQWITDVRNRAHKDGQWQKMGEIKKVLGIY